MAFRFTPNLTKKSSRFISPPDHPGAAAAEPELPVHPERTSGFSLEPGKGPACLLLVPV